VDDLLPLLQRFESIGNNCEFGIVQRAGGYDAPGLFRNVGFLHTDQIIHAIDNDLGDMFDDGRYSFVRPDGWPDYALDCHVFGFRFHTGVPQTEPPTKAAVTLKAFRMMKRLFREGLRDSGKIYVYRHNEHEQTDRSLADRLSAALRRFAQNWLMVVCQDERPETRFAYAHRGGERLILAGTPHLSAENPPMINFAAWEKLMRTAVSLRCAVDDGAYTVHHAPALHEEPIFSILLQDLDPGCEISAEAEVEVPNDFTGSDLGLMFWGYETIRSTSIDLGQQGVWQPISVQATVPALGDRAVAALRVVGGETGHQIRSRNWKLAAHPSRKSYRVTSFADLPKNVVRKVFHHPPINIPLAPIRFGQIKKPDFPIHEIPDSGWEETEINRDNIQAIEIAGAIIHGEEGIVTVGDDIVLETIRLARFGDTALRHERDGRISLAYHEPSLQIGAGMHVFCGYPGAHVHANFLVDLLPAAVSPFAPTDRIRIWPRPRYPWQAEYLNLLNVASASVFLDRRTSVFCHQLFLPALSLIDSRYFPHPDRMHAIIALKQKIGFDSKARRRIYVTRNAPQDRRPTNEEALIALLTAHRFEIITLSRLSVAERVRIFSESAVVVATQGASDANVIFCRPGAVFCEILLDSHVDWSMRRLASIVPLQYGCVISRDAVISDAESKENAMGWQIDLEQIRSLLQDIMSH